MNTFNRHNFIRWSEPASRITDIYAPQGCEAHRAFTYFFPDEYYAFLINVELPLTTGYILDLADADTMAIIQSGMTVPVPLLQKSGKCFLFASFFNTVSRIGHCRFVLRDGSGVIAVSNPVWFENDAKAKDYVNKIVYADVRPLDDFDYASNQFFTELHLMISRQAMDYESELKQYRNISDRQRRNVNFDIDKTYLLDSYFFNDGDSDATAFIFKHRYILVNGVQVIVKDGYSLQEHKASYIAKGSVTVYEVTNGGAGSGKLPPSLSFRWVAGKEMCEDYEAPVKYEFEWGSSECQGVAGEFGCTGYAFGKTLTLIESADGEATTETYDVLEAFGEYPAIESDDYKVLSVEDATARTKALLNYAVATRGLGRYKLLNDAVKYDIEECPLPEPLEYVPTYFEDIIRNYEYDAARVQYESIPIRTSTSYPGRLGVGLVQKTMEPVPVYVSAPADMLAYTQGLYWMLGGQTFEINGKTYMRETVYSQRLPSLSIQPATAQHQTGIEFNYLITVSEDKEYLFITSTDNYCWLYVDDNLVFQQRFTNANSDFMISYAFKVFLTAGTHIIKNVWQDAGGAAWGTVLEIYDAEWTELAAAYEDLASARAYLYPLLVFSTGQYFTDVDGTGHVATGELPNFYLSDTDVEAGWKLTVHDNQAVAAFKISESPSGFMVASYLKSVRGDAPADIDGYPCSESGKPQAVAINAESFAGVAVGNLVKIEGIQCQVSNVFKMPDDLYDNPDYQTSPVLWEGAVVAEYLIS